ncbi:MAG TPA: FAD-dependent monooxygenase [Acidimicrobiales bacterium]|nr:FAD-dependent monooxygenase [Acidimicrobiales bacterium]
MKVAVIGAGIGGLATAVALHRGGIEVRCFEQARVLAEVGAGITLAPNGLRVLRHLGLADALDGMGSPIANRVISLADGTEVANVPLVTDGSRSELVGMHRADLFEMLLSALPDDVLALDHRCTGFDQDDDAATVRFADGARHEAVVVIAADGIHSSLQRFVVPPAMPVHSGSTAYRGTLPSAAIGWPAGRFQLWMGPGRHFLVYPLRADQLVNYVGFVSTSEEARESWSAPGDPRDLAAAFAGFDETVVRIIDAIDSTFTWGLYDREPLPCWTAGRLALLGDAAHPMLPHAGQGANQALEDAVTVATLLARADRATVPRALARYAEIRQPRTARLQQSSRSNGSRFDGGGGPGGPPVPDDTGWIHDHDAVAVAEEQAAALGRP